MAKKRAIPVIPLGTPASDAAILGAMKENLEIIMGQRVTAIDPLSSSATLSDSIEKIYEILARLQQ